MTKKYLCLIILLIVSFSNSEACTIFSAKDSSGNIWTGSNEDKPFSLSTRVNIVAATENSFGYLYFTNSNNSEEFPQGGMNDAGLFYDANSIPPSIYKDFDKKRNFPGGINEMIFFILKRCKTVKEALAVFKIYRLQGLEVSQLHFADKYGNLGIINSDSMWITKGNYQISTNYNLCHLNKDNIKCWRYPVAERMIKSREIGLETFRDICDSTSQKKWTNCSTVKNLNTGDIWFYYAQDFSRPYKTNIKELLKQGTRSFYLYELFKDDLLVKQIIKSKETEDISVIILLASLPLILFSGIYIWVLKRRLRKLAKSHTN
jgi:hypothetical protein